MILLLYYFQSDRSLSVKQTGNDRGQIISDWCLLPRWGRSWRSPFAGSKSTGPQNCGWVGTLYATTLSWGLPPRLPQEATWRLLPYWCDGCWATLIDPSAYQKPDQETLKAKLTAEQYQVTPRKARRNVRSTMPMIRPWRGSMIEAAHEKRTKTRCA